MSAFPCLSRAYALMLEDQALPVPSVVVVPALVPLPELAAAEAALAALPPEERDFAAVDPDSLSLPLDEALHEVLDALYTSLV